MPPGATCLPPRLARPPVFCSTACRRQLPPPFQDAQPRGLVTLAGLRRHRLGSLKFQLWSAFKCQIWENGLRPWELRTIQGHVEAKIDNDPGTRAPRFEVAALRAYESQPEISDRSRGGRFDAVTMAVVFAALVAQGVFHGALVSSVLVSSVLK